MKLNVGVLERILRVIVGMVLIALVFTDKIGAWGWIGVVPLVTGAVGTCPLYSILGVNTCSTHKS
jgi:hypothetical protein